MATHTADCHTYPRHKYNPYMWNIWMQIPDVTHITSHIQLISSHIQFMSHIQFVQCYTHHQSSHIHSIHVTYMNAHPSNWYNVTHTIHACNKYKYKCITLHTQRLASFRRVVKSTYPLHSSYCAHNFNHLIYMSHIRLLDTMSRIVPPHYKKQRIQMHHITHTMSRIVPPRYKKYISNELSVPNVHLLIEILKRQRAARFTLHHTRRADFWECAFVGEDAVLCVAVCCGVL